MKLIAAEQTRPRYKSLNQQGKATLFGLEKSGFDFFDGELVGKRIKQVIENNNQEGAVASVQEACKKLPDCSVIQ